jgi:histidinol phosphatase-like enzyme (inositol monophosphatase family)
MLEGTIVPLAPDETIVAFANDLADAARPVAMRYFRAAPEVEIKADLSPVTVADRSVEATLREMIAARFPGHGIVGEEFGGQDRERDHVWVIDPIDGTQSFIVGSPMFGVLIALLHKGRPVLGIIDHPALGQRWLGVHGRPTLLDGRPVRVSGCTDLAAARFLTNSPHYYTMPEEPAALASLHAATRFTSYGMECHGFGLVASGYADLIVETGLDIFDYLAAVPVIEGAGGMITDWAGQPLTIGSGRTVLAAGSAVLHAEAARLLARGGIRPSAEQGWT